MYKGRILLFRFVYMDFFFSFLMRIFLLSKPDPKCQSPAVNKIEKVKNGLCADSSQLLNTKRKAFKNIEI